MKIIDAFTTRQSLGFKPLIAALEQMFIEGCEVPPRHNHAVGDALTVLIMPAWQPGAYLGIKTVNIAPGNSLLGLPGLSSTYQLFDARTGLPLAQIDGNEITSRRTAAASALAASRLARPDARRLLVVGSGRVASLLPAAYRTVLPIDVVLIWDRRPEAAQALAERLTAEGIVARAAPDLQAAVRSADIISCATLATMPIVRGAWLRAGSHLDLIGSFTPTMRESDDDCMAGAAVWVDTDEALHKSGDLLAPIASGAFKARDVRGNLGDLCRHGVGRMQADERTVFKSVGTALEDLAAAILVYESVINDDATPLST